MAIVGTSCRASALVASLLQTQVASCVAIVGTSCRASALVASLLQTQVASCVAIVGTSCRADGIDGIDGIVFVDVASWDIVAGRSAAKSAGR